MWLAAPEGVFPEEFSPDLALILDAIPDGVYGVGADGRTMLVNRAAARILGYEPQDLVGKVPHDLMHHSRPDGTPFPHEECPLSLAGQAGRPYSTDHDTFWRRDGTSFPVEYESQPLTRDGKVLGFVVTFRDITERLKNEERIRELLREQFAKARAEFQYAQLKDVLAQTPAIICVTRGPRHVIETVNEQFRELLAGREVIGLTIREAFPNAEHRRLALMDLAYESGQAARGTELPIVIETESGFEERYYNYVYQPLRDEAGFVYGLMTHAVDVTREVLARQQLQARTAELERTIAEREEAQHAAQARAEELAQVAATLARTNAELDAFAYAASHDLRAPLRGIANLAQWIEEDLTSAGTLQGETREMLELMRTRMHRMEALIEGILQYSRAGRVNERPVPVDTARVVREVAELLGPPPRAQVILAEDMPTVLSPLAPLQQVFLNLIGNGFKYNDASEPRVWVEAEEAGDFFRFSVRDNGPGIPPEFHDRIWGIFQTLEARDKVEGTGIGLSLVKKHVETAGGRAWVESAVGNGATFHFLWPKRILPHEPDE